MQSTKTALLVVITALLLALHGPFVSAQDQASTGLVPEARDYLNQVLDMIQKSSVKQDTKWDEFRRLTIEKAGAAKAPADTYPAIRDALKRLGDGHSTLLTPDELATLNAGRAAGARSDIGIRVKDLVVITVFPNSSASRAAIEVREKVMAVDGNALNSDSDYSRLIKEAKSKTAKGVDLTLVKAGAKPRKVPLEFGPYDLNLPLHGKVLAGDVGLIELPAFGGNFSDPNKAIEAGTQYAERVHALIRELDQGKLSGWIIDLRQNGGGNMWAMLAGIGPILGNGEVGGFFSAGGSSKWSYQDGQAMINGNVATKVDPPYKVKKEKLPVVILTDEITASSAEAVVIAFKGRDKTRFIGMPTRGLPTANQPFKLSDGAVLNLTTALDADRSGKTYDNKIPPDTEMKTDWTLYGTDDEPVIKAAVKWLRSVRD